MTSRQVPGRTSSHSFCVLCFLVHFFFFFLLISSLDAFYGGCWKDFICPSSSAPCSLPQGTGLFGPRQWVLVGFDQWGPWQEIREQEETGAGYISPSLSLQSSLRLAVLPTDRMLLFRVSADFPHPSLQALCLNRKGCCFQVPTAPRSPLSPTQFVVAPFINKPSSFYPI